MYKLIKDIKENIIEGINLTYEKEKSIKKIKFEKIISCGMGGSGIGGRIVKVLLEHKVSYPIFVHNDYNIPAWVDQKTLVLSVSYSGNTEETLDATEKARQKKAKIIGITTGGTLSHLVENYIKIPSGLPPRCAIAYLTIPQLIIASKFSSYITQELKNISSLLSTYFEKIEKKSKNIAKQIKNTIPVIYSSTPYLRPIAYRYQCQLNENSEIFVHHHYIPEMNHNEIMGINKMKRFSLLWLYDKEYDSRYTKRIKITNSLIKNSFKNNLIIEPFSNFKTEIEKTFFYIVFGDLLSYFLAKERKIDPFPVKRIEELKKRMKE